MDDDPPFHFQTQTCLCSSIKSRSFRLYWKYHRSAGTESFKKKKKRKKIDAQPSLVWNFLSLSFCFDSQRMYVTIRTHRPAADRQTSWITSLRWRIEQTGRMKQTALRSTKPSAITSQNRQLWAHLQDISNRVVNVQFTCSTGSHVNLFERLDANASTTF